MENTEIGLFCSMIMKKMIVFFVIGMLLCGCSTHQQYVAVLSYPNATPLQVDGMLSEKIILTGDVRIDRTISEKGKAKIFLYSLLSKEEIENMLMSSKLPSEVSLKSFTPLKGPLPSKPEVRQKMELEYTVNQYMCQLWEIPVDVVSEAISKLDTDDPEIAMNTIVKYGSGKKIKIGEVVEVELKIISSHIIRDY